MVKQVLNWWVFINSCTKEYPSGFNPDFKLATKVLESCV